MVPIWSDSLWAAMGPGAKEEMPRKSKWTHTDVIWTPGGRNYVSFIRGSLAPSTVPDIKRATECLLLNKLIHPLGFVSEAESIFMT